jgi:hypothetical protein
MKHKALKKIKGGKSTQKVNIQKQKIKVQNAISESFSGKNFIRTQNNVKRQIKTVLFGSTANLQRCIRK